ncbi:hypothetical protein V5799_008946 [Amblyomma americanum]|uniref:Uncharacterized protein n=1 Tax=Amblyomma americanum TaxID=6943 RepID=A0AAQ4FBS7_AMBAM
MLKHGLGFGSKVFACEAGGPYTQRPAESALEPTWCASLVEAWRPRLVGRTGTPWGRHGLRTKGSDVRGTELCQEPVGVCAGCSTAAVHTTRRVNRLAEFQCLSRRICISLQELQEFLGTGSSFM